MRDTTIRRLVSAFFVAVALFLSASIGFAQAPQIVSASTPLSTIVLIPISATQGVTTANTLTIPAPAGNLSNYVCYLAYELSVGAGGTVQTNTSTTSANFNGYAATFSNAGTANTDTGVQKLLGGMSPATGCVKSTVPGTATTFTMPSLTAIASAWYAVYFQAQ